MTGESRHGSAKVRAHHGMFTPATGSFEFTGENAQASDDRNRREPRLLDAARSFLRRVGGVVY